MTFVKNKHQTDNQNSFKNQNNKKLLIKNTVFNLYIDNREDITSH